MLYDLSEILEKLNEMKKKINEQKEEKKEERHFFEDLDFSFLDVNHVFNKNIKRDEYGIPVNNQQAYHEGHIDALSSIFKSAFNHLVGFIKEQRDV